MNLFLRRLWARKWLLIVAAFVLAVIAALTSFTVTLSPPRIERGSTVSGIGSAELLVDTQQSLLTTLDTDVTALASRASLFAVSGGEVEAVDFIAEKMGVAASRVAVQFTTSDVAPQGNPETTAPVFTDAAQLSVSFTASSDSPVVTIATSAASRAEALRLAIAAQKALLSLARERIQQATDGKALVTSDGRVARTDSEKEAARTLLASQQVTLRTLGGASSSTVVATDSLTKPLIIFIGGLLAVALLLVLFDLRRRGSRASTDESAAPDSG